jgi:hypothetical protein
MASTLGYLRFVPQPEAALLVKEVPLVVLVQHQAVQMLLAAVAALVDIVVAAALVVLFHRHLRQGPQLDLPETSAGVEAGVEQVIPRLLVTLVT